MKGGRQALVRSFMGVSVSICWYVAQTGKCHPDLHSLHSLLRWTKKKPPWFSQEQKPYGKEEQPSLRIFLSLLEKGAMVIKHVWENSRDRGAGLSQPGLPEEFFCCLIHCLTFDCSMAKSGFSPPRFLECRVYVLFIVWHPQSLARIIRTVTMTMVMLMSGFSLRTDLNQYLGSCFRMFSTTLICLFTISLPEADFHDLGDLASLAHSCNPNTPHSVWHLVGARQIRAVCLVSKFLWRLCNPRDRSFGISGPILVHACFFHSCITHWLQAIPLHPVYHGTETESSRNHWATWHHLRTLQVCGFRLPVVQGGYQEPRQLLCSIL